MTWSTYAAFAGMMAFLAMMPGPDTMVVLKNALTGGARGGGWACAGISVANVLQGTAVALGLGAVITRSQPAGKPIELNRRRLSRDQSWFLLIFACKITLGFLAFSIKPWLGWLFLAAYMAYTYGEVIVLYLSVLPQFLTPGVTDQGDALLLAYTVAALGLVWQVLLLFFVHRVRGWLQRRRVRRTMDGATGVALVGFGAALAFEG